MYYIRFIVIIIAIAKCVNSERFCNKTINDTYHTKCISCSLNEREQCYNTSRKMSSGRGIRDCTFTLFLGHTSIKLNGCRHQCERESTVRWCCPGQWGVDCQECPSTGERPCSGHGNCSDGIYGNGTCSCMEGFNGTACELCTDQNAYGKNCTGVCECLNGTCDTGPNGNGTCACHSGWTGSRCDQVIQQCKYMTCSGNEVCVKKGNRSLCLCDVGYERNKTTNLCEETDPCSVLQHQCHKYASCNRNVFGYHACLCTDGYHGDGFYCEPIDLCQYDNYGGCDSDTSICLYTGPGKSQCRCIDGFQNSTAGCQLIDVCQTNTSLCHKFAECNTIGPLEHVCKCKSGYYGDGDNNCYGNILERLIELNEEDEDLRGTLNTTIRFIQESYKNEISEHGPYTFFAAVNDGYKTVYQKEVDKRHVIQQNLVAKVLDVSLLKSMKTVYSIQGVLMNFSTSVNKGKEILKYRHKGSKTKVTILRTDLQASNGIINIVNIASDVKTHSYTQGDTAKTMFKIIQEDGKYNRLEELLLVTNMSQILRSPGSHIVFAPNNSAFSKLPNGAYDYLKSPEGKGKLITLLQNHIVKMKPNQTIQHAANLIMTSRIVTLSNEVVSISVSPKGQIQLNDKIIISQSDIMSSNGYYHHIEGVIIPDSIQPILPHICNRTRHITVKGICSDCSSTLRCLSIDTPLKQNTMCRYSKQYKIYQGCSLLCNRTITKKECCKGFYGAECKACPGDWRKPCSGNGKCLDRIGGTGTCKCQEPYTGTICETCTSPNKFGPTCNKTCSCIHGTCDNRIGGDGMCKQGSCRAGVLGKDCSKQIKKCGGKHCSVHASCTVTRARSSPWRHPWHRHHSPLRRPWHRHHSPYWRYRRSMGMWGYPRYYPRFTTLYHCNCISGYNGDGKLCQEIDPCQQLNRGNCHKQATCVKTRPGKNNCTCGTGWQGDGLYCYPETACSAHTDCHNNASCIDTGPGKYICQCNHGFHGNGTYCFLKNPCTLHHGGCDIHATCKHTGLGKHRCSCKSPYQGTGYKCLLLLDKEIANHQNLSLLDRYLKVIIGQRANYLGLRSMKYTIFAPDNGALAAFNKHVSFKYWIKYENVIKLLHYSTINGSYTLQNMVGRQMGTLASPFKINVTEQDGVFYADGARITQSNIEALNGYINIIDKVLEPYPVPNPPLGEFLHDNTQQYSTFRSKFMDRGFLPNYVSSLFEYTIFLPKNTAWTTNKKYKLTAEQMKFFVLPTRIPLELIADGQSEATLLSDNQRLVFTKDGNITLVNGVPITKGNIYTRKGIVHEIDGILVANLNRCDDLYNETIQCQDSNCTSKPCPALNKTPSNCTTQGCGVDNCIKIWTQPKCCSGYYGSQCKGTCLRNSVNLVCSGHGYCDQGINGTGICMCDNFYNGTRCERCWDNFKGQYCNISRDPCYYNNGGCSINALCTKQDETQLGCSCLTGFHGDGKFCEKPCNINHGNCHQLAGCNYSIIDDQISCTCPDGFYGDGITTCNQIINLCHSNNGNCSERANCKFYPPIDEMDGHVECQCKAAYVGNGAICYGSLLDTLKELTSTSQFFKILSKDKSLIDSLENGSHKFTVFVPSDGINDLSIDPINNYIVDYNFTIESLEFKALSNNIFIIDCDYKKMCYVNGSKILRRNILTLGGYINILESPFANMTTKESTTQQMTTTSKRVKSAASTKKKQTPLSYIIGPSLGGGALISLVILAVFLCKRPNYNNRKTPNNSSIFSFNNFCTRKGEEMDTQDLINDVSVTDEGEGIFQNPVYEVHNERLIM